MKPNKIQINMIDRADAGLVDLPKTHGELAEIMRSLLLAYDHKELEAPIIERCRESLIKLSIQKGGLTGWVYLSAIRYILENRKYYKKLKNSMVKRGVQDPLREIARGMVSDGLIIISPTGTNYAATAKAIKELEEKESEMTNLMREARLAGKLEI